MKTLTKSSVCCPSCWSNALRYDSQLHPALNSELYIQANCKCGWRGKVYYELTFSKVKTDYVPVPMVKVNDSSVVKEIGYDKKTKQLHVKLKSGDVYVYYDVSAETFTDFILSDSKGRFYNSNIKSNARLKYSVL